MDFNVLNTKAREQLQFTLVSKLQIKAVTRPWQKEMVTWGRNCHHFKPAVKTKNAIIQIVGTLVMRERELIGGIGVTGTYHAAIDTTMA